MFEISVFLLAGRLRTVRPCVVKKKIVFLEVVTLVRTLVPILGNVRDSRFEMSPCFFSSMAKQDPDCSGNKDKYRFRHLLENQQRSKRHHTNEDRRYIN